MNMFSGWRIRLLFTSLALLMGLTACDGTPSSDEASDARIVLTDMLTDVAPVSDGSAVDAGSDAALEGDAQSDAIVDAAVEWEALSLNSLVPNRGTVTGGTEIRLIGSGFTGQISVLIRGQACSDVSIDSPNHLRCSTPPGTPGLAAVTVVRLGNGDARETATLDGGFTYFEDVSLDTVSPARIPVRGGSVLILTGAGLIEGTRIRIGENEADDVTYNEEDGSISVVAPAGVPGPADVTATNFNGSDSLPGGVFYYEQLEVAYLEPPVGPLGGGNPVTIHGQGLMGQSVVLFGANPAEVGAANETRTALTLNAPRGAQPGLVDVSVENDNGVFEVAGGYVYFDDLGNGFQVAGISPNRGRLIGGNDVWVAGNGFTANSIVRFDGREIACEFVDQNRLRCTAPPGAEGIVPVTVEEAGDVVDVAQGYTYFQALELIAAIPDRSSISGGTRITITGSGFTPEVELFLGELPLDEMQVVDEGTITGLAPANSLGPVDVRAVTEYSRAVIPGGFTYFDPAADFGGVWGEPIDTAVNVTVIHGGNGARMEEVAVVAINQENDFRLEGITNLQGQITLSDPALAAPLNITAAKEGFEATTIEDVNVENVTIILIPNDGEGDPPPPVPAAVLRGVVSGLDVLPKPVNEVYVNVIVVETTHSSPYNRSRLPPPGPGGLLLEDGPYEIIARPGELAVIATAGELDRNALKDYQDGLIDYWTMRRSLNPLSMGIRRFVAASPGDTIEELDVQIDHPMDLTFPVDLDNPPIGADPGPRFYTALPRLNFGPEGYWELDTQAVGLDPNLTLRKMPRVEGWDADINYYLIGIAYSATENNQPMSISIEETRDVEAGLLITPFVGSAFVIDPVAGGVLGEGQQVTWGVHDGFEGPIAQPSGNLILIEEPALGPPKPLWRYITPSLVTQFLVPELPAAAGAAGLGQGVMFLTVMPFILDGVPLDFDDFTYNELAQYRWKAWAQTMIIFQR